jgi:hypothetical protein
MHGVACEEFDDGVSEVEVSDVVTDWRRPGVDLDSMTALVLDGFEVVAFTQVIAGRAEVDVLPSHRGRGLRRHLAVKRLLRIGTAVLRWKEQVLYVPGHHPHLCHLHPSGQRPRHAANPTIYLATVR